MASPVPLDAVPGSEPRAEQESAIRMNDSVHLSCITRSLGEVCLCSQLTEKAPAGGAHPAAQAKTWTSLISNRASRMSRRGLRRHVAPTCLLVPPIRGAGRPPSAKGVASTGAHTREDEDEKEKYVIGLSKDANVCPLRTTLKGPVEVSVGDCADKRPPRGGPVRTNGPMRRRTGRSIQRQRTEAPTRRVRATVSFY